MPDFEDEKIGKYQGPMPDPDDVEGARFVLGSPEHIRLMRMMKGWGTKPVTPATPGPPSRKAHPDVEDSDAGDYDQR
ncbi:hypothetical protein Q5Y75_23920 [Ruegeria sp. 2205SS24-7]|uniref:hypothetical protein n=1 Tax=Ruegeria discodermiae TaxID=3064389 RepID=UPI002740A82B|nr:hypothetical protein [Ruegeria sp. 2205SS24-7]MDP5220242.1 hypothetical protein [Ruegeria sp. 2205SS24-7]